MRSTPTMTASIRLVSINPIPFRHESAATIRRTRPATAKPAAVFFSMDHRMMLLGFAHGGIYSHTKPFRDRPKPLGSDQVLAFCARGHGTGWHLPKLLKNAWIR